jgi:mRNA interferase RelE/StbE
VLNPDGSLDGHIYFHSATTPPSTPCPSVPSRRARRRRDAYSVKLASGVVRTLQAGPPLRILLNAAWAIFEFIRGPLSQDPWRVSKPLHDELEGFRGARRGEYRVIIRIEEEQCVVRVLRVDH